MNQIMCRGENVIEGVTRNSGMNRRAGKRLTGGVMLALMVLCATLLHTASAHAQKSGRANESSRTPETQQRQQQAGRSADEVEIVLTETFVNGVLEQMFALGQMPSFPIAEKVDKPASVTREAQTVRAAGDAGTLTNDQSANAMQPQCASEIVILREVAGERTRVRFADGRIGSTVAFQGNYNAPLVGCLRFQGTAQSLIDLVFDENRQTLVARVAVQRVDLVGVPALLGGVVTGVVRSALDQRIKQIDVLRADQLGAQLPLSNNRPVRLRARRVRSEIINGELRLRINYGVEQVR